MICSISKHQYKYYKNILKKSDGDYFRKLLKATDDYDLLPPIDIKNEYLEQIIFYYLQCRPNIKVIISQSDKIPKLKGIKVAGIKKIKLSNKACLGLLYQIYQDNDLKDLEDKLNGLEWDYDTNLNIMFYESDNNDNVDKTIILHDFNQVKRVAMIVLNKNSLSLLEKQDVKQIVKKHNCISMVFVNTYNKWLTSKFTPLDQIRFILQSGAVLFAYGLRNTRDIDLIVCPSAINKYQTKDFEKIMINDVKEKKTKYIFLDAWLKDLIWRDYFDEWAKQWTHSFGAESLCDSIFNPKYHFYFQGMKFMILDAEIERRKVRVTDKLNYLAMFDLYLIKERIYPTLSLPKIPRKCKMYRRYFDKKTKTIKKFKQTVCFSTKDLLDWIIRYIPRYGIENMSKEKLLDKIRIAYEF